MALDQQIKEIIDGAARQLSGQFEEHLRGLAAQIGQAASADRVSAIREVRLAAEAEIAKRSQEAVAAAQAEHSRRLEEAVAAARMEGARRIDEAVATARAEQARRIDEAVATARASIAREHDATLLAARSDVARRIEETLAAARGDHARQLEQAVAAARTDTLREHEPVVGRQIDEAVAAALAHAHADADRQLAQVRADTDRQLAQARADADRLVAQAAELARREATHQTERSLVEVRAAERQAELAQIDRVAESIRRLDNVRSLTDVLDVLGETAAHEAPRVALFLVRGARMAGWRASGFGSGFDPQKLEVGTDDGGLLARAVAAGAPFASSAMPAGEPVLTPFGPLPPDNASLAVPVRVGGETVALLYADDAAAGGHEVPSAWPEVIEILVRHAARCLEVLTVTRVAHSTRTIPATAPPPRYAPQNRQASAGGDDEDAARRYARLLVSEIRLYHEGAVTQGRRDRNLLDRLREEIERARKLYDERVPAPIRSKTDFFGQELVRTLANGDATLLGTR